MTSRAFFEVSTHPVLIEIVGSLLGENVMLWGASLQTRSPNSVHPWHCDIESAGPGARTLAVWIGIANTNSDSSMEIVPYSHRFGVTVQEVRHQQRKGRGDVTSDDIGEWARGLDERARVLKVAAGDGEALFFDGRLWHASRNISRKTRHALLLQYATPATPIRIPDLNQLNWPFVHLDVPRPPCLILRGRDESRVNRIVAAPAASNSSVHPQLGSRIYPLRIPLEPDRQRGWKPYPIFTGSTADLENLSCHASVLTRGHTPHPPHAHAEEEVLVVLAGEVEIETPDRPPAARRARLALGDFVYYPSDFHHTLTAVSDAPANYLMLKWHDPSTTNDSPLSFGHWQAVDRSEDSEQGFRTFVRFEGPTRYLRKLHCHASTLAPGAGYEPHVDAYDVVILLLEGEVETLGERVAPFGVIFYRAGEPHGMRNVGSTTAKYLVFEFHGRRSALTAAFPRAGSGLVNGVRSLTRRVVRRGREALRNVRRRA